jgi:chromosome segregation ATPase
MLVQSQKEEFDRLKRDLQFANERAEDATRSKSSEMSSIMQTLNRQIAELEDALAAKNRDVDGNAGRVREMEDALARLREEKDAEIAILQEGMDETIKQMSGLQMVSGGHLMETRKHADLFSPHFRRTRALQTKHSMHKSTRSFWTTARSSTASSTRSCRLVQRRSTMRCTSSNRLLPAGTTRPLQNTCCQ